MMEQKWSESEEESVDPENGIQSDEEEEKGDGLNVDEGDDNHHRVEATGEHEVGKTEAGAWRVLAYKGAVIVVQILQKLKVIFGEPRLHRFYHMETVQGRLAYFCIRPEQSKKEEKSPQPNRRFKHARGMFEVGGINPTVYTPSKGPHSLKGVVEWDVASLTPLEKLRPIDGRTSCFFSRNTKPDLPIDLNPIHRRQLLDDDLANAMRIYRENLTDLQNSVSQVFGAAVVPAIPDMLNLRVNEAATQLLFPVNVNNAHWVLVRIHRPAVGAIWSAEVYDSLGISGEETREVAESLIESMRRHLALNYDIRVEYLFNNPCQIPGSNDCGVFVLYWIREMLQNTIRPRDSRPAQLYIDEMRRWVESLTNAPTTLPPEIGPSFDDVSQSVAQSIEEYETKRFDEALDQLMSWDQEIYGGYSDSESDVMDCE